MGEDATRTLDQVTSAPAPEGAENLRFTPSMIVVEGGFPELEAEGRKITAGIADTQISVAQFYSIASELQALYAEAGYPLARVVVPEQRLLDGQPARIVVVDGFLEEIDTSAVAPELRQPIARVLAPLVGRRRLKFQELERRLTLAGNYPGASVRSTLGPGNQSGSARLVIESGHRIAGGSVTFDNRASSAFGRRDFNYQLSLNSLLNVGEQIYSFVSVDPFSGEPLFGSRSPKTVLGGGIVLPLGSDGLSLNMEATHSVTRPLGGFFVTRNEFNRYSMRLSYPLILGRTETLTVTPSLELLREQQTLPEFGRFELSRDSYTIARLSSQYSLQLPGYSFFSGLTFSVGHGEEPTTSPRSRGSATTDFSRLEANVSVAFGLPKGLVASTDLRVGIVTSGGVPNAELFGLDAPDALSTFTAGALTGDEGATSRISLRRPFAVNRDLLVTPYVFAAAGAASFVDQSPFDATSAHAYGLGVETNLTLLDRVNLFTAMEYGYAGSNGLVPDDDRLTVNIGLRF